MNFFQVCEVIFIVAMLAVMGGMEKKSPDEARRIQYWAFVGSLGTIVPLVCIEALSAFGLHLFDVNWTFTPLNIMSGMCVVYLVVMSGKKLFGIVDTSK
ncbi:MAG: hypothetical protein K2O45_02955 [Oscillospiraceae bacterium]|nr:hypothetical protein [Oscillospiraceae bacterium]